MLNPVNLLNQMGVGNESGPGQQDLSVTNLQSDAWAAFFGGGDQLAPGAAVQPELLFDGKQLIAFDPEDGTILETWDAVSGELQNGETDPDRLDEKRGPIPEGEFTVNPDDSNEDRWWKLDWGDNDAWGDVRTQIKPNEDTEMYGRDGMYMHGGNDPGSIGCVDLVGENNDFHDWLAEQNGPVNLTVNYDAESFDSNPELDINEEWERDDLIPATV